MMPVNCMNDWSPVMMFAALLDIAGAGKDALIIATTKPTPR